MDNRAPQESSVGSNELHTLWAARLVVFIFIGALAIWFVYIPWKVRSLGISEFWFSLALFVIAFSSLITMQICSRILVPKFGTGPIMAVSMAIFPILYLHRMLLLN